MVGKNFTVGVGLVLTAIMALGCEIVEIANSDVNMVPTRFQQKDGNSSSFDISFRPVEDAIDYEVTVYQTETSVMPLESSMWSDRSNSRWGLCVPGDEQDYCIRMREQLYEPHWFTITAIYADREVEGSRFCFQPLIGREYSSRECPQSETKGWVSFERNGSWGLEREANLTNVDCEYHESCRSAMLDPTGTPSTNCPKICKLKPTATPTHDSVAVTPFDGR